MPDPLGYISKKIQDGKRLDFDDGLALYESHKVLQIGHLAEQFTLARHGPSVYYSINRHINYTNVCQMECVFCGFSRPLGHDEAYVLPTRQVINQAVQSHERGATEVHIVGGIHPDLPFDYYNEMIQGVKRACPDLSIKAFTAVEIIDLSQKCNQSIEATLQELMESGLTCLPGGGAEILDDDYFDNFCPRKPRPDQWLEVHSTAHRLGMMTNATMLYGYRENAADRVNHMLKLRDLQDRSTKNKKGIFQCFVPLPYTASGNCNGDNSGQFNALNDLMTIAISRLMLDNFNYIKAFWPMLGDKMAQISLCFGANDLDGTVEQYQIVNEDSGNKIKGLSESYIRRLIIEADRTPVLRNTNYKKNSVLTKALPENH